MSVRHKLKHPLILTPTIIVGLLVIGFLSLWPADWLYYQINPPGKPQYGVTFSTYYVQKLGLAPNEVFQEIIDNLQIKYIRIPVYWDSVEKAPGRFDFSEVDRLLDQTRGKNIKVTLAIGYKVPRWPECFPPKWAKELSNEQFKERILMSVEAAVDHFKNRPEVINWQVENEALLAFGNCRFFGEEFLKQEVNLVRSKDQRPVILTDSGELSTWITAMEYSDLLGASLYRIVWNPIFGYLSYPLPPIYYKWKGELIRKFFAQRSQGMFISELQAEPWLPDNSVTNSPISRQIQAFSLDNFKKVVEFTVKTEIDLHYFWGVEWWYFMRSQGHPEYWNFVKELLR